MVFLWKLMILSCLLAFHTAHGGFELTTTHQRINPLSTKDFILNCTYDYESKKSKILSLQLAKVIKKGAGAGVVKELATLNLYSNVIHILSPSPDVKYTGGIVGEGKVFLSAKWKWVPTGLGGIYKCKANVVDSFGHINSLNRQLQIGEEKSTVVHAVEAIKELQMSDHKMQAWKKWMVLAFNRLERVTMKALYSSVYKNKYYIVYNCAPGLGRYAEMYCQARGGYLDELNDFDEWKFVKTFVQSVDSSSLRILYYYISGRKNLANNKFYWPRMGKRQPAYFNWSKGQPRNNSGAVCVCLSKKLQWLTINCYPPAYWKETGFICEMPRVQ